MAKTILISDRVNSFFTNNKIKAGTEIPTSGSYIKGDIIVNVGANCADEPMWICTEDGNPGTWGLVGIGGGGGSLVSINESVTIDTATSEVSLGSLAGIVSANDKLIVHYNSAHLMEGVDFTFNSDYTKIVKVEGVWNSNNDVDSVFTFELLKNVETVEGTTIKLDSKLSSFVNNVNISSAVTEVGIGIDGYNHESDMLMVFKNSTFIVEGVDYTVNGNKIVSMNGTWNSENSSNYSFAFVVFKEVAIINPDAVVNTENLVNGSVTMDKLADDVKQAIEGASNIDLTNYQEKVDNELVTVDKTIVGAINEIDNDLGDTNDLITSVKSNTVVAINEVANTHHDMKQSLVDVLVARNVECSINDSWTVLFEHLIGKIDESGGGSGAVPGISGDFVQLLSLGTGRYNLVVEEVNGLIYVIGGSTSSTSASNLCHSYNPSTNSWTLLTSCPITLACITSVVIGDDILIFSTDTGKTLQKPMVYSTTENKWHEAAPSSPYISHVGSLYAGITDDNLTVLYPNNNGGNNTIIEKYSLDDFSCDYSGPITSENNGDKIMSNSGCCQYNDKLFLFGGSKNFGPSGGDDLVKSTVMYDITNGNISLMAEMPVKLKSPIAECYGSYIYVIGGKKYNNSWVNNTNVYVYDINNDSWSIATATFPGDNGDRSGSCIIDNRIHVIGGYGSEGNASKSHYMYTIE